MTARKADVASKLLRASKGSKPPTTPGSPRRSSRCPRAGVTFDRPRRTEASASARRQASVARSADWRRADAESRRLERNSARQRRCRALSVAESRGTSHAIISRRNPMRHARAAISRPFGPAVGSRGPASALAPRRPGRPPDARTDIRASVPSPRGAWFKPEEARQHPLGLAVPSVDHIRCAAAPARGRVRLKVSVNDPAHPFVPDEHNARHWR